MKGQASQSSGGASGLPAWWGGHSPMPMQGASAPMGGIAGAPAPTTAPIAAPFASNASTGPYGMHTGVMAPGMPIGGAGGSMAPGMPIGGAGGSMAPGVAGAAVQPGGVALGQPAPMANNAAVMPGGGNPMQANPTMPPQFANFMNQLPPGLLGALQNRFGGAGSPLAGLFSMMGR